MRDAGPIAESPSTGAFWKKERKNPVGKPREMEFLDINLTKYSNL